MADHVTDYYKCHTYTVDPTNMDDDTKRYKVGSRRANTQTGRFFVCTDATTSNATWICTTVPNAFYDHMTISPSPTNSTTYESAASFTFVGTTTYNLASISVVAAVSSADINVTFDLRVIDVTNGNNVIAEAIGLHSQTKTIFDLGPLTNLPASSAVFDIEVRRSGTANADTVALYSALLTFA